MIPGFGRTCFGRDQIYPNYYIYICIKLEFQDPILYIYVLPDDVIGIFMGFFSEHIFGEYIFHGFHGFDGGQATSIAGTMVATGLASGNRLVEIYV